MKVVISVTVEEWVASALRAIPRGQQSQTVNALLKNYFKASESSPSDDAIERKREELLAMIREKAEKSRISSEETAEKRRNVLSCQKLDTIKKHCIISGQPLEGHKTTIYEHRGHVFRVLTSEVLSQKLVTSEGLIVPSSIIRELDEAINQCEKCEVLP